MYVVGGESLIDLIHDERVSPTPDTLSVAPGGSPYNCARALSKLGVETGFLSPIGADWFGDILDKPLAADGVIQLLGARVPELSTLAAVNVDHAGKADYKFYRHADRALDPARLRAVLPERIEVYQIGGFCPVEPEDAAIWTQVIEDARRRGATISFDPNLRPLMITDWPGYRARLAAFFEMSDIVKVSDDDLKVLDPDKSIEHHARDLRERYDCALVAVTLGAEGSRAFTASGTAHAGVWSPPVFGDTVGAGDSLMAGILCWLGEHGALVHDKLAALDGEALAEMLRFGAVVAGINCGRKGCQPPTRAEVDAVLADA